MSTGLHLEVEGNAHVVFCNSIYAALQVFLLGCFEGTCTDEEQLCIVADDTVVNYIDAMNNKSISLFRFLSGRFTLMHQ